MDRWASKEALLFDAVATVADEPPSPDTGSVRADLLALFAPAVERFADDLAGRLLVEMAAAAAQDVALREVQRHLVDRRREAGRTILRHGIDRGELPADIDLDLALDLIIGPAAYRCFLSHRATEPDMLERTVDVVLAGLRSATGSQEA